MAMPTLKPGSPLTRQTTSFGRVSPRPGPRILRSRHKPELRCAGLHLPSTPRPRPCAPSSSARPLNSRPPPMRTSPSCSWLAGPGGLRWSRITPNSTASSPNSPTRQSAAMLRGPSVKSPPGLWFPLPMPACLSCKPHIPLHPNELSHNDLYSHAWRFVFTFTPRSPFRWNITQKWNNKRTKRTIRNQRDKVVHTWGQSP